MPASRNGCLISLRMASTPLSTSAVTMPDPMSPPPSTATHLILRGERPASVTPRTCANTPKKLHACPSSAGQSWRHPKATDQTDAWMGACARTCTDRQAGGQRSREEAGSVIQAGSGRGTANGVCSRAPRQAHRQRQCGNLAGRQRQCGNLAGRQRQQAEAVWQPCRQAEAVWQPCRQAEAVWQPCRQAEAVWQPGRQAEAVWQPCRQAEAVWQPGRQVQAQRHGRHGMQLCCDANLLGGALREEDVDERLVCIERGGGRKRSTFRLQASYAAVRDANLQQAGRPRGRVIS
eukprot:366229-Chlamydomonas_euryale.AAC.67